MGMEKIMKELAPAKVLTLIKEERATWMLRVIIKII